ncbi:MAG: tyrosine-type recombinase/integrase [bacterium]
MKGSRPLTLEEIQEISQSFFGKYEVRDRCLFTIGINTGARISELVNLNVGDVWQHGRPVDLLALRKSTTKGKKARVIPLNDAAKEAVEELVEWKRTQEEFLDPGAALFVSRKGGRLTRQQTHNILKGAFEGNELQGKVTTHSLRKTVATTLHSRGIPLGVIQEVLGHESVATTRKYIAVSLSELTEAMGRLAYG